MAGRLQIRKMKTSGEKPKHTRIEALEIGLGVVAGTGNGAPFGLREKATEEQKTENHYDRDYDDLDQAHYISLNAFRGQEVGEQNAFPPYSTSA